MGKILMVDLSSGEITEEILSDDIYEKYLGGQGLAGYLMYNRIPAGADALGPENILCFVPGLLTGAGSLFTGRWSVVSKSPLTGTWGDANCGGNFAPAIKRCGYDGIFVKGISEKPVYLYSNGTKVELRDASHLWGMDAVEAEQKLIDDNSPTARVALIGPAGEKLSLISGVCNDRGRIAARSGLGAVMGAKRLKAVVLDGKKRIQVHDKQEVKKLSRKVNRLVQFQPPVFIPGPASWLTGRLMGKLPVLLRMEGMLYKMILKHWGTGGMNRMSVGMGDSPLKNWKGTFKDFGRKKTRSVDPDIIGKAEEIKYHCYSCPLGCGGICKTKGEYKETHKPEYETVLAFGGLCMNEDLDSILYLNELFNRGGMDTISGGGSIAFAIECYEKGILTKEDTDGIELKWGKSDAIIALAHKMMERDGIGDLLADGAKKAAEKIGSGATDYAIHAGGQEPAMHDSRLDPGLALHYCVEPTPGRHTIGMDLYYGMYRLWKKVSTAPKVGILGMRNNAYKVTSEQAVKAVEQSKFMSLANSTGFCLFGLFLGVDRIPVFEWLNAATGWEKSPDDYMETGARIQTMKQAFNIKHGVDPWQNKVSKRALGFPPLEAGPTKGRSIDIDKMMMNYWEIFGWDRETGKPGDEIMIRYGIGKD